MRPADLLQGFAALLLLVPIAGCYADDILATRRAGAGDASCLPELLEVIERSSGQRCAPLAAPLGSVTCVGPEQASQLGSIVAAAAAGTTILLRDGAYRFSTDPSAQSLSFRTPGVTLRSASGMRDEVILDGEYLSQEMIQISASDVVIADITLQHARQHAIHVTPPAGANIEGVRLYGLRALDAGNRSIKVDSTPGAPDAYADRGSLACSTVELTSAGRERIQTAETGCDAGGLIVSQARGWEVSDNTFRGIYCPGGGVAQHAIHFMGGSRDTLVERNAIVDCARGVGFGLEAAPDQRFYPDDPYPGITPIGHYDGMIRNNFIAASVLEFDTGIELAQARGSRVLHNSIFHPEAAFSSLDYRYPNTQVEVMNNLVVRFTAREQGQAALSSNLEGATGDLYADPASGDLHLSAGALAAIDQGVVLPDSGNDIDGSPHDVGPPDLGADEAGAP